MVASSRGGEGEVVCTWSVSIGRTFRPSKREEKEEKKEEKEGGQGNIPSYSSV